METRRRHHSRLIGLTVGVLLALLVWPATGWIVRSHARLAVPTAGRVAPWASTTHVNAWDLRMRTYEEAAARHTNDFDLQFAAAVTLSPPGQALKAEVKIGRLRELAKRYPDRADLYATLLRFAMQGDVMIRREAEESWFRTEPVKFAQPSPKHAVNTAEQLAAFDRDAAEGERLDPDNAYFPVLRAVGLFAANRDEEALAALKRAAGKPAWREYYDEEVRAVWRLHEEAYGNTGALPRLGIAWAILLPHLAQVRTAARVAVAKASRAEQSGRVEEGLAIRDSVRRCGRLLRAHSTSAIGSLVGIAIQNISLWRPGGAPHGPEPSSADAHRRMSRERLDSYTAYLRRNGHADRIAAVEAEAETADRTGRLVRSVITSSLNTEPQRLAGYWVAALTILSNALLLLVFGGLAALLSRHRSIRRGVGWARGAHWTWAPGLLVGGGLLFALFGWQVAESTGPLVETMWSYVVTESVLDSRAHNTRFLISAVAWIIPGLTLLVLGGLSLLWRVPLSVGVIRGLRGLAVPMACVLLLVYAALIPFIARQEAHIEGAMERTVKHEGRYLAELAGEKWPE